MDVATFTHRATGRPLSRATSESLTIVMLSSVSLTKMCGGLLSILARLTPEQAREEVSQGAMVLSSELGLRPEHFAYPYGYKKAAGRRDFDIMKDLGFKTAVTTRGGMIFPGHIDHMTALPRISVNGMYQKMKYFAPLTTGLPTRLGNGLKRVSVG